MLFDLLAPFAEIDHVMVGRYVVSLSTDLAHAPYAGTAELYFRDTKGWADFQAAYTLDGFEKFVDDDATHRFGGGTEMLGIDTP